MVEGREDGSEVKRMSVPDNMGWAPSHGGEGNQLPKVVLSSPRQTHASNR